MASSAQDVSGVSSVWMIVNGGDPVNVTGDSGATISST